MHNFSEDDQLVILILGNILNAYREIHLPSSLHKYVKKFNRTVNFEHGILTINDREEQNFLKLLNSYFSLLSSQDRNGEHIQYDVISSVIYQLDDIDLRKVGDVEVYLYTDNNLECKFKEKIDKHIRLALLQYRQIIDIGQKADELANKSLQTMEEVENIRGTIYSEFFTILGVFSALIFGLFGGFEGIKGVLSLFKSPDNFGTISMYCGLVTLMIVTIIFALIQFTGRLIGKNIKSCCQDNDCNCMPQSKYKVYTICVYISVAMILLGAAFSGYSLLIKIIYLIILVGILLMIIPKIISFLEKVILFFKKDA